ncbi:2-octaprenyl-6-methoxyphenyl hydroxylase, partial [Pseudomonas aeruginosa]
GQGFHLWLRGILARVYVLLHDVAPRAAVAGLQRYLDGQRLDQQMTVGFSDRVTRVFANDRALLGAGRNLGLLVLDLLPPAKRWFARQAMGLGAPPL